MSLNVKKFEKHVSTLCQMTSDEVFDYLESYGFQLCEVDKPKVLKRHTGEKRLRQRYALLQQTKSRPLFVCHADTVLTDTKAYRYDRKEYVCHSPELDDRLGIACMLYALDHNLFIGGNYLVCDNEEVGQSTAKLFAEDCICDVHDIKPNWLVEFDRRGTDVVTYDYESVLWHSILESHKFTLGQGSFSDICYLDDLEVVGVNVGIGYHNEHSQRCHASLIDCLTNYGKTIKLYDRLKDVRLAHDSTPRRYTSSSYGWSDRDDYYTPAMQTKPATAYNDTLSNGTFEKWFDSQHKCDSCEMWFERDSMISWGQHKICLECNEAIFTERYNGRD